MYERDIEEKESRAWLIEQGGVLVNIVTVILIIYGIIVIPPLILKWFKSVIKKRGQTGIEEKRESKYIHIQNKCLTITGGNQGQVYLDVSKRNGATIYRAVLTNPQVEYLIRRRREGDIGIHMTDRPYLWQIDNDRTKIIYVNFLYLSKPQEVKRGGFSFFVMRVFFMTDFSSFRLYIDRSEMDEVIEMLSSINNEHRKNKSSDIQQKSS